MPSAITSTVRCAEDLQNSYYKIIECQNNCGHTTKFILKMNTLSHNYFFHSFQFSYIFTITPISLNFVTKKNLQCRRYHSRFCLSMYVSTYLSLANERKKEWRHRIFFLIIKSRTHHIFNFN